MSNPERRGGQEVSRVRITSIPEGGAPEDIRQVWLGVILPTTELPEETIRQRVGSTPRFSILRRRQRGEVFGVRIQDALDALREQKGEEAERAISWFTDHLPPRGFDFFIFNNSEGERVTDHTSSNE